MSDLGKIAGRVITDVLEKMAFMFADAAESPLELTEPERAMAAQLEFKGPLRGTIRVAASDDLCRLLACNILGVEPDQVSDTLAEDALKEFLNVVSGEFIEALAENRPLYELAVPTAFEMSADAWRALAANKAAVGFLVEDAPLLVFVEVSE